MYGAIRRAWDGVTQSRPAIDEQACLSDTPVHKYLLDWLTASCKSLRLPPQAFVFLDDGNWGTGS